MQLNKRDRDINDLKEKIKMMHEKHQKQLNQAVLDADQKIQATFKTHLQSIDGQFQKELQCFHKQIILNASEERATSKLIQKLGNMIKEQELNFTRLKRYFMAGDLEAMADLLDLKDAINK